MVVLEQILEKYSEPTRRSAEGGRDAQDLCGSDSLETDPVEGTATCQSGDAVSPSERPITMAQMMKPDIERMGLLVVIGIGVMIGGAFLLARAIITEPDKDFAFAEQVNTYFSLGGSRWMRLIAGTAMASLLAYNPRRREAPENIPAILISVLVASLIIGGTRHGGTTLTLYAFYCLPLAVATVSSRAFVPLAIVSTPLAMWAFATGMPRDHQVAYVAWDVIKAMKVEYIIVYGFSIGLASAVSALFSIKIANDIESSSTVDKSDCTDAEIGM